MRLTSIIGLALIATYFVARYAWVVDIHWINDDLIFLDHARRVGFLDLWGFDDPLGNAYRPLTRTLYFWLGSRVLGTLPGPYHLVNLAVALTGLVLFFLVCRHLFALGGVPTAAATDGTHATAGSPAGAAGAAVAPALLATLLFAAHPAAGTPTSWVCGIQDLACATLALGAVLAHLCGRRLLYPLLLAAAILSKELAVALPFLLVVFDVVVEHRHPRDALRRQLPALGLVVVWMLGNRWLPWHDLGSTIHSDVPGERRLLGRFDPGTLWLTVRSLLLVEPFEAWVWPYGVAGTLGMALPATLLLMVIARAPWPRRSLPGLIAFGILWSLSGILPLITVISHFVYYAYYPALGAVLVVVALLVRWGPARDRAAAGAPDGPDRLAGRLAGRHVARIAIAAVLVAVLTAGAGFQYHARLCDAHNIRRASGYLWSFRADMLAMRPTLPDSARCYFWNIPSWIGFQLADGPAMRIWYDDPTAQGFFLSQYEPDRTRPDLFFGHDDHGRLVEIVRGLPDPGLAAPPPIYAAAHADLGTRLAEVGEVEAAIVEWRKALEVDPGLPQVVANLGIKLVEQRQFAEGARLLERATRDDPGRGELVLYLVLARANLGELEAAYALVQSFLATAPESPLREQALDLARRLEEERR